MVSGIIVEGVWPEACRPRIRRAMTEKSLSCLSKLLLADMYFVSTRGVEALFAASLLVS